jgi:subtilisin family serine protease
MAEAPDHWQLLDVQEDGIIGISLRRAERELLAGRLPQRTVIVAVIDGGVDTLHADLRPSLWSNPGERGGTSRDDDGNGYVDDLRGWNFIGGPDGRSVNHDTYEVAREYALCSAGAPTSPTGFVRDAEYCEAVAEDLATDREEAAQMVAQIRQIRQAYDFAIPLLQRAVGTDSLTPERVGALRPAGADVRQAQQIYRQLVAAGITGKVLDEALKEYESQLQYKLNPQFDPRAIVGDEYKNLTQRFYGNADVMGPDAKHGSHVSAIIAGMHSQRRFNGAPAVQIMALRAVPDGDERDKDVANAIRYAVDNGAHIINMSFGKAYSPHKAVVDDAIRHALSRGVLLIHAAGNDGADLAEASNFPTPVLDDGTRAALWIEVGASSWKGGDSLAAPFSNYGNEQVDVFAPGVDILAAVPGGERERLSGTSMAAPVVSGLAALLMAYHAELTAADVRRIILESAVPYGEHAVIVPGTDGERASFGRLSRTGAIVNAHQALRLAQQGAGAR